jgi:hypothetical protein
MCKNVIWEPSPMRNPWTKKDPFMSLWLSSASRAAGIARGHAVAEAYRQKKTLTREATRFWTGAWLTGAKPKQKR